MAMRSRSCPVARGALTAELAVAASAAPPAMNARLVMVESHSVNIFIPLRKIAISCIRF
jgi:hypothetical protein